MLYVIYGFYQDNALDTRDTHYPAHNVHLSSAQEWGVTIEMSGPLVDDNGSPIGSLLVLNADSKETIVKFHEADPFFQHNIWQKTTVTAFDRKR